MNSRRALSQRHLAVPRIGALLRDALGARLVSLRDLVHLHRGRRDRHPAPPHRTGRSRRALRRWGGTGWADDAAKQITEAAIFSAFVLIGNPLIVILIMAAMRYPVRVGFLAGLTVAQISEFSLILAALGLSLGHITSATVSLITVVGLITIGVSTYMILYSHQLYDRLKRGLAVFERRGGRTRDALASDDDVDIILFGLGRFGTHLADRLTGSGYRVLAVDFDPNMVKAPTVDGLTTMFGSAEDIHLLDVLPLDRARYVVSAIPVLTINLALLDGLRQHQFAGTVVLTAHTRHDAELLRAAGVTAVLEPFSDAAEATSTMLDGLLGGNR